MVASGLADGGGRGSSYTQEELNTPGIDKIDELYPETLTLPFVAGRILSTFGEGMAASQELTNLADNIASGHAFTKHVIEAGEFPEISNLEEFSNFIRRIIKNPSEVKNLRNGRTGYWDEETGTIVIKNPKDPDGGTAYRPPDGKKTFDTKLF